ncbi:MAG: ATP-binding protein [Sphingosinicella sp.]
MASSTRSKPCTGWVTALPRNDASPLPGEDRELRLGWSRQLSLRQRILAVNIFAIIILAGSIFYLDGFRSRLTQERIKQSQAQAVMMANLLGALPEPSWPPVLVLLGRDSGARLRVYGRGGQRLGDSWQGAPPTYNLREPAREPFFERIALALDNGFDAIVGARQPPQLDQSAPDRLASWPEAQRALSSGAPASELRRAPEGTPYISAAARVGGDPQRVLLLTINARDIREVVRSERLSLALILAATLVLSVMLSRFLARTIANPLRRLALAAHRVRLGRAREVELPVSSTRRDEIGLLARALHDMTLTLRQRIDATEAFASEVTHELKNPLASLRSAVDSLERIDEPGLRRELLDVAREDVARLDRLVVDIAEASRLDAELSRATFDPVDLGKLIESMLPHWQSHGGEQAQLRFRPREDRRVLVHADESRLARLLENLIDNAISFSPEGGTIDIGMVAGKDDNEVRIEIEDDGPGVPTDLRETIFQRFTSIRSEQDFGRHSGLGLAIARAIAEGHGGQIHAEDRADGRSGARFVLKLPMAET